MGQLGVRIINIMLFTASCFFAAGVFNHVADSQLAPDYVAAFQPTVRPETPQPSWNERKEILDRNLFGAKVGAGDGAPEPVAPKEDAKATKLPIKLLGTMAGVPASLSTAVIDNTRRKKHQVVRVGDTLKEFEYVTVMAIEPGRVVVKNRDIIEELLLSKTDSKPSAKTSAAKRPERLSAHDRMRERRNRNKEKRAAKIKELEGRSTNAEELEEQLKKIPAAMTQSLIRDLEPSFGENGEIDGVLVGDLADDAILARAGLEKNDIILSLNGIKIDSAGAAARVLRELAKCKPMTGSVLGASGTRELNITESLLAELNCIN